MKGRPLLLIDARRAPVGAVERTMRASEDNFEIWILGFEKPSNDRRISKWIPAEEPLTKLAKELQFRNRDSHVLIVHAGETSWVVSTKPPSLLLKKTHDKPKFTWSGWAIVPKEHFSSWTSRRVNRFIDGALEVDSINLPFRLSTTSLKKRRALIVAARDFDQMRDDERDFVVGMIEKQKRTHLTFFIAPVRIGFVLRIFDGGETGQSLIPIERRADGKFDDKDLTASFSNFFDRCGFDSIHFAHATDLSPVMIQTAKLATKTAIVVPTQFAKRKLIESGKFNEIEIEVESLADDFEAKSVRVKRRTPVRTFAFLGAFAKENGSKQFADLVRSVKLQNVKWLVFGEIIDSALALQLEERHDVQFFGPSSRSRTQFLLESQKVDAALILRNEDDFSDFAVLDALDSDVWPFVSAHSASAERVESTGIGTVVDTDSLVSEIRRAIGSGRTIPVEPTDSMGKNPSLNV